MAELGDAMIGAVPPLELRFCPPKPMQIPADGHVEFTIAKAEIWAGGRRVHDKIEQQLAWYFMLHGGWEDTGTVPLIQRGRFTGVSIRVQPNEWPRDQGFAMLDDLSGMISRSFRYRTIRGEKISALSPSDSPDSLGARIPDGYS